MGGGLSGISKPMVCVRVAFHENDGNREKDENDEDNSDSYKQGVECSIRRNHGSHGNDENHRNPGCKPRVPQTTGLEIPEFRRPSVWRAVIPPVPPPPHALQGGQVLQAAGAGAAPQQTDKALLRDFRARLKVAGGAHLSQHQSTSSSNPLLPLLSGNRI